MCPAAIRRRQGYGGQGGVRALPCRRFPKLGHDGCLVRACYAGRPAALFTGVMSSPADASVYSKDHPFPARITENRLLTKPGSGKETRHFVVHLEGSGLHYKAGDSLGVFAANRPAEVEEILQRLGATGSEPVSPAMLKLPAPIPLREALAARLALAKPTRRALEVLAAQATDAAERAKLAGLLAPESKDVLMAFLEQREFVDLLAEFPSARP